MEAGERGRQGAAGPGCRLVTAARPAGHGKELSSGLWAVGSCEDGAGRAGVGTEQARDTLQCTKLSTKPASGPPFPIQGEMIHVSTAVM